MIRTDTSLELVPESILKKWAKEDKPLRYREGMACFVPERMGDVVNMVKYLRDRGLVGFDTEATSNRAESADIVGMSFSVDDNAGFYIPIGHEYGQNLNLGDVVTEIEPILQGRLSMAGGKYDWQLLKRHGIDLRYGVDSQSMSRLLGEVEYGVGLKPTVARMFAERMIEFSDVMPPARRKEGQNFRNVEIGLASLYAVPDAVYTRMVSLYAMANLPEAIKNFLLRVEHDAMRIAGEMEWVGVPLDAEFLATKIEAGIAITKTLREEAILGLRAVAVRRGKDPDEVPDDLNLHSPKQVARVLFEVCEFEPVNRSKKTRAPSVDKASIEKMAERDPEVDWVRRYRSAYSRVHDLTEMVDFSMPGDGWLWLHGSLNPTGSATGRWSGKEPNLQNIPKGVSRYESRNSVWEVAARDAIMAPPGSWIVTADYSQIELRVAAGESQCRMWLDAFANGDDVHAASGAAIYGISIESITKAQRQGGKTFNFALLFGQEVKSTAALLGISVAEAQQMQNQFWEGLPEVKSWRDSVHAFVRKHKYVETKFGRRRWLRGIDDENRWIMMENLRESVNTVVQGTAADILKIGLTRAEAKWKELGADLFLLVHDQYVWLVPETVTPSEFCIEMDALINFEIAGYPEMVSDYSIGKRFDSLVAYPSAVTVPSDWDQVLQGSTNFTQGETGQALVIELPNATIEDLQALVALVTDNPGDTEVVLALTERGIERSMQDRTCLTPDDAIKIKAAVGASARVTLV